MTAGKRLSDLTGYTGQPDPEITAVTADSRKVGPGTLFAALAGLSLTANTGIGTPVPGPYTLLSVAAIVLGGVSLAGGRGGLVGPIIAVVILQLIRTDMTFLNVNTNLATVLQGVILIGVVMVGSLIQLRRARG